VLLQGYYGRVRTRELQRKVISQTAVDVAQARTTQLQKISEYRMLDSSRGVVAIPIERAMELVAAERGSGASSPPRSSTP
jgi:hypothetical protein